MPCVTEDACVSSFLRGPTSDPVTNSGLRLPLKAPTIVGSLAFIGLPCVTFSSKRMLLSVTV